jgi:hypothetical protein
VTVSAVGDLGAAVYVDDVLAGEAPTRLEVPSGTHALRIEAPGHLPWARLVELSPGVRPDMEVTLSTEAGVALARDARTLAEDLSLEALAAVLSALEATGRGPRALVLVVAGGGVLDRALALVCTEAGCRAPVRLEGTEAADLEALEGADRLEHGGVSRDLAWLDEALPIDETVPPPPPFEWWGEWWPWATLGVLAAGGLAAGIGAAVYEPPQPALVIVIEPDF